MSDTHISGVFSSVQITNLHSVLIMETDHFIFLNAAPRCSIIGDVLLLAGAVIEPYPGVSKVLIEVPAPSATPTAPRH